VLEVCWCRRLVAENDVNHRGRLNFLSLGPRRILASHPCTPHFHLNTYDHDPQVTMPTFLQRLTAPPAQSLNTRQPSPYTVLYTVSTRPLPNTVFASIASYVGLLLRIVLGSSAALLLWLASHTQPMRTEHILLGMLGRLRTQQLLGFANSCQWMYLAPCVLGIFVLVFRRNYTGTLGPIVSMMWAIPDTRIEESLTVLRGLGIQTSTTSSTYLQAPTTRFIPTTSIQDIFIYEAFKGFEVRFYLAIVVEGEEDAVVVFPTLLPRRAILEEVWRGTRKCLWEHRNEGGKRRNEHDGKVEQKT
jgi:phosphatidylinositol glycan class H protein